MKSAILSFLILAGVLIAQEPASLPVPEPFERGEAGQTENFDEPPAAPLQVQVTVEFIEVPQADATRLLYNEKLGKDGTKLRAALQTMVDSQKASVFETMMLAARSGQKATMESIREVIYPTEYQEPELPTNVPPTKEEQEAKAKAKTPRSSPPLPTAFETRNTGNTMEIEPTIGEDGAIIDLRFVPEIVFDTGVRKWNVHKDELGNESAVEMPYFYSLRTNTSLTLADGMPQLLSVLTPKGADGTPDRSRKLFAIVTTDIVKVKLKPNP